MKNSFLKANLFLVLLFGAFPLNAQQFLTTPSGNTSISNYNYHDAFAPLFYKNNGSETRSVSGQPGAKYWQNRADYQLTAKLNEQTNEIIGTETLVYTNNSPDKLSFLWMNLDQNLFKSDSRGNAIIPVSGSRNGAMGEVFDGGHHIKSIKVVAVVGRKEIEKEVKFQIIDTRLQVFLPQELNPKGGTVKMKIEFSYVSPKYGSDRTGVLETENGKIFTIAQWYPRMCVYDDIKGWNTLPYLGAGEFYLEYGWNDHKDNFRDFWIDPEHAASYIIGFKKLKPLNHNRWLELNAEIIQTAQSTDYLVRTASDWYIYENGGYNHFNQILGAGTGIGNNIQTMQLNVLNGLSKAGIKFQRIQHQPTPANGGLPFESLGLRPLRWTDIGVGFIAQKHWKNIIITPEVNFVNSMNYAWTYRTNFNFFAQLNLTYLW